MRPGQQFPYFVYRHPVDVGILLNTVLFYAAQIFYRAGIVPAMKTLHFIAEAEHKINPSVGHVQQIEIGFGG